VSADALSARTLELVNVHSPSREEGAIADSVAAAMPWRPTWREGETLWYDPGGERPQVIFAGHLDTVPANENFPGRLEGGVVHGLGASDMKAGVAVMVELARAVAAEGGPAGLDPAFLFFPREELPIEESPLPALFATGLTDRASLVIVLEPTDNAIQLGCVGSIHALLRFEGVSAHAARPWLGVNAIRVANDALGPILALEPEDVLAGGLLFREVLTVTRIEGGRADNVVPDEVVCSLNFRYAPTRTPAEAESRLRELAGDVDIVSNSPAARVAIDNPLVGRLRELGGLDVEPKQAWTPVAQFAERGLDAINFGPGATRYAHRRDEQVEVEALVRCFEALRALLRAID
jgi:succinyl-diaminopimelate desuccinylase